MGPNRGTLPQDSNNGVAKVLIVRDCKQGVLLKLNKNYFLMFFQFCNMCRDTWVLRRFRICLC